MLNLFLLFTDTFLLCRFFLAWLIPQLLQKSQLLAYGVTSHEAEQAAQQSREHVAPAGQEMPAAQQHRILERKSRQG